MQMQHFPKRRLFVEGNYFGNRSMSREQIYLFPVMIRFFRYASCSRLYLMKGSPITSLMSYNITAPHFLETIFYSDLMNVDAGYMQ